MAGTRDTAPAWNSRRISANPRPAADIATWAGSYTAHRTAPSSGTPLTMTLSQLLQRRLAEIEVVAAAAARSALAGHGVPDEGDLLIVDGPLRGRQHLPRTLGY